MHFENRTEQVFGVVAKGLILVLLCCYKLFALQKKIYLFDVDLEPSIRFPDVRCSKFSISAGEVTSQVTDARPGLENSPFTQPRRTRKAPRELAAELGAKLEGPFGSRGRHRRPARSAE